MLNKGSLNAQRRSIRSLVRAALVSALCLSCAPWHAALAQGQPIHDYGWLPWVIQDVQGPTPYPAVRITGLEMGHAQATWRCARGEPNANGGQGQVVIMTVDSSGLISSNSIISALTGGFPFALDTMARFGAEVTSIGDVDDDGNIDLAVLASHQPDGTGGYGVVYICFMNAAGSVREATSITRGGNGLSAAALGTRLTSIGHANDLNGDGTPDLLIGAPAPGNLGTAWAAYLSQTGTLIGQSEYHPSSIADMEDPTNSSMRFANALTGIGDVDGNGHADLAIADSASNKVYIVHLFDGSVVGGTTLLPGTTMPTSVERGFGAFLASGSDVRGVSYHELMIGVHPGPELPKGAVLLVDPGAGSPDKTAQFITNDYATEQNLIELNNGLRIGHSACFIPDRDDDGIHDLLVLAHDSAAQHSRLMRLFHRPYPLNIHISVTDQTPDELGSVQLRTEGGCPPYTYTWSKELQDPLRIDVANTRIDTIGLRAMGIDLSTLLPLTENDLEAMEQPVLNAVPAGQYWVGVKDSKGNVEEATFAVGLQINALVEIGVETDSTKKEVLKSGQSGWTNMQLRTKNVLPKGTDGWLRFTVPTNDKTLAVGFNDIGTTSQPGYQTMDVALVLMKDTIRIWNGTTLEPATGWYSAKDAFLIERRADGYLFYLSDTIIHVLKLIDPDKDLGIQVAIYDQDGQITDIATNFLSTFGVTARVTHCRPLDPKSGSVSLSTHAVAGGHTMAWSTGTTAADLNDLSNGTYQVSVTNDHFARTITKTILVGHEIQWLNGALSSEPDEQGVDLHRTDENGLGWNRSLISKNFIDHATGHRLSFIPHAQEEDDFGALLGFKAENTGNVWAAWWVHAYGDRLLANTIGPDGIGTRTFLRRNDELQIVVHAFSIHYLKNGELVEVAPRPFDLPSNIVAALRTKGSQMRSVWTTVPVPLNVHLDQWGSPSALSAIAPSDLESQVRTDGTLLVELPASLPSGPYAILRTGLGFPTTERILLDLANGKPTDLRFVAGADTVPLDTTLYTIDLDGTLYLADGPTQRTERSSPRFIPSIKDGVLMTPNGDGDHDSFAITATDPPTDFAFSITDQQDLIIFSTNSLGTAWNGRFMNTGNLAPKGIYNYSVQWNGELITAPFMVNY